MDAKTPLLQQQQQQQQAHPPVSRPKYKRRRSSFDASTYNSTGQSLGYVKPPSVHTIDRQDNTKAEPGLTLVQILGLTICMAGVQFTWAVELSYGTPYLLSLNISKELTALVWLAGPLSGLLVQPLIGALSDKCTSRFGKRRPFIVVAGILTCLSMLGVAYAKEMGAWLAGDDGPATHTWAVLVAVTSFYFLDFTLNGVQAICRALILDIPPLWQQEYANAWSARMSNSAQVIGYFVGFVDLVKVAPWLGDSQIKGFCIIAILVFCSTLAITCVSVRETPYARDPEESEKPWYHTFVYIWRAFRYLPRPVQSLCNTQFFAWMGWFPFLFYSTQWVSDIYFQSHPPSKDNGDNWAEGTRAGSFALLCYSVISVVAGVVIPALASKFPSWTLTRIYTLSHLTVAFALLSAWFVSSVQAATIVLAVMGIPWAIVLWVPFSLVGEYVSYEDERRQEALPSSSTAQDEEDEFDAGMILGVHNMYIVFPQFAVAIIASFIFAMTAGSDTSSVSSVLAFGGLMALVAAALSRFIVRVK